MSALTATAPAMGICALHEERSAVGTCTRCGNYFCEDCFKILGGRTICASCLKIPGVDYLRSIRDAYWGKRDGWVWYLGIVGCLGGITQTLEGLAGRDIVATGLGVGYLALFTSYLLLRPWARRALFAWPVIAGIAAWLNVIELQRIGRAEGPLSVPSAVALTSGLLLSLIVFAAYRDARNKLAFRVELSDAELQKLHARVTNSAAARAFYYGVISLVIPMFGIVSLIVGLRARRKTDPNAWPPVQASSRATWGIVFSLLGLVFWVAALSSGIFR